MSAQESATPVGWPAETDAMLKLLDENFPPVHQMSGAEARAAVAARARPIDNENDVRSATDRLIDGSLRVRIYRPWDNSTGPLPVILFLHGGGFVFCSIETHDGFCRRVSRGTRSVVVSVDYRLAPEHPAPAAAEDAYSALVWIAAHAEELGVDPKGIIIAGDSAGANLAAVCCLMTRDRGGPAPAGQVLLYPVIAPDFDTDSYSRYAIGHFNTLANMQWYWRNYLGGGALPEPAEYAAPIRAASLAGLPPAIVVTAGRDPLCSEGRQYARALRAAAVAVRHRHYPEQFHGFITIANFAPAQAALALLWRDMDTLFGSRRGAQT